MKNSAKMSILLITFTVTAVICFPLANARHQELQESAKIPDQDQERYQKEQRAVRALTDYRKTGKTDLTKEEIDDFLETLGIPRSVPRFRTYPVCEPKELTDNCGVKDRWSVQLRPDTPIEKVAEVAQSLLNTYGGGRVSTIGDKPSLYADSLVGGLFYIEATEETARRISEDERVRYVQQESKSFSWHWTFPISR
ncbi:MAG: hypothetical protein L0226_16390 [Acidobacteria bacterium]|nr:hypothetical protein [Acidobacteriota bacterium]